MNRVPCLVAALLLCACTAPAPEGEDAPAAAETTPAEVESTTRPLEIDPVVDTEGGFPANFRALGTEPFWAIHVSDGRLRYMTPDDPQGQTLEYTREQTERDEIAITALLGEQELVLSGRIAECSDGMSERIYPFSVTLRLGSQTMQGCARTTEI